MSSSSSSSSSSPSVSELMFGREPLDESLRQVSDMLWRYVNKPSIEVEAKIGTFNSRTTFKRMHLEPRVTSECVIQRSQEGYYNDLEFSSTVSLETFRQLNEFLNRRFGELKTWKNQGKYHGPLIEYERVKEEDEFYKVSNDRNRKNNWVRVSVDPITKERKRAISKDKVTDLNFFCPHRMYDFRISVSDEVPVDFPDDEIVRKRVREKDRISYKFDNVWRVDITVVHNYNCDKFGSLIQEPNQRPTYEIEMELGTDHVLNLKNQIDEYNRAKQMNELTHDMENPLPKFTKLARDLLQQIRTITDVCSSGNRTVSAPAPPSSSHPQQHQQPIGSKSSMVGGVMNGGGGSSSAGEERGSKRPRNQ